MTGYLPGDVAEENRRSQAAVAAVDARLADLEQRLEKARAEGLFKTERVITTRQGPEVTCDDGVRRINLCSNNYLGLSGTDDLVDAGICHQPDSEDCAAAAATELHRGAGDQDCGRPGGGTGTPAARPGARPPGGGAIRPAQSPADSTSHETIEFEFHISPVPISSRPPTNSGTG